jgi:hypothetical protein
VCIGSVNWYQLRGGALYGFMMLFSAEPARKYFTGRSVWCVVMWQAQPRLIKD